MRGILFVTAISLLPFAAICCSRTLCHANPVYRKGARHCLADILNLAKKPGQDTSFLASAQLNGVVTSPLPFPFFHETIALTPTLLIVVPVADAYVDGLKDLSKVCMWRPMKPDCSC